MDGGRVGKQAALLSRCPSSARPPLPLLGEARGQLQGPHEARGPRGPGVVPGTRRGQAVSTALLATQTQSEHEVSTCGASLCWGLARVVSLDPAGSTPAAHTHSPASGLCRVSLCRNTATEPTHPTSHEASRCPCTGDIVGLVSGEQEAASSPDTLQTGGREVNPTETQGPSALRRSGPP